MAAKKRSNKMTKFLDSLWPWMCPTWQRHVRMYSGKTLLQSWRAAPARDLRALLEQLRTPHRNGGKLGCWCSTDKHPRRIFPRPTIRAQQAFNRANKLK